jgi:general secretion pathway protein G
MGENTSALERPMRRLYVRIREITEAATTVCRRVLAKRAQAFTLLELMVVVVILGILAAFIVPRISKRPEDARVTKAKIEISNLEQALELYYLDTGDVSPGIHSEDYDLFSFGKDGVEGGEGYDSDITNWE